MSTKTITASATFTEEQFAQFAKFKGYQENITNENGDLIENPVNHYDYLSNYYKNLFASDVADMQKTILLEEIEKQKQDAIAELDGFIQSSLTVTVE